VSHTLGETLKTARQVHGRDRRGGEEKISRSLMIWNKESQERRAQVTLERKWSMPSYGNGAMPSSSSSLLANRSGLGRLSGI
jgi:hypothetical protein